MATTWDGGATTWDAGATVWDEDVVVVVYGSLDGVTRKTGNSRPAQISADNRINKQTSRR